MMVIIIGENRVEYNKIRKSDYEKMFFGRRNQVYKVVPDGLVHIRMTDVKGRVVDEECVVFKENSSIPYDVLPGVTYKQDDVLAEIDLVRESSRNGLFKKPSLMRRVNEITDAIYPILGIGILAGVLLWVVINMMMGGSRCSERSPRRSYCAV